jgi:protein SCO1/2
MVWLLAAIALLAGCSIGGAPPTVPSFALTNQSGRVIRAEELRGRAVVISFFFTSCHDVCPLLTTQLARAQGEVCAAGLDGRVRFVSITVDPTADTPEVLQRYAAGFGADPANWDFLTGQPEEVGRVVREMGVFTEGDRRPGHTDLVLFVNPRGEVIRRSTGGVLGPSQVLDRVRRLLG